MQHSGWRNQSASVVLSRGFRQDTGGTGENQPGEEDPLQQVHKSLSACATRTVAGFDTTSC